MTQSEKLQAAANLHKAIATMNELRGDTEQAQRDWKNCEFYSDEASKARFAKKYGVNFPLLADADHAVAEKYGVWQQKSLYGRKFMGNVRTTYLIGADGKVSRRWDNVKVDGHAEEVLEAVKALKNASA